MTVLRLRTERLQWLETDAEVVALDERSLVYLNANTSGALLWRALAAGTTHDELVRTLRDTFDVDQGTAERDVDRFLADLDARGLLER
jgi:hypothetical protein